MAAAEARAVWQRTANRCFVQEDAKRAPKLACCPSTSSSSVKHVDVGPSGARDGQDHLVAGFTHLSRNPSYCNLSPDSKWWLQVQPNYAFQRGLMDEQVSSASAERKGSGIIVNGQGNDKVEESYEFVEMASVECEFSKCSSNEFSSDPGYSWLEGERSEPWWKMTDRDELASFVAQRSHDFMENCDLPHPRNTSFKRDSYDHVASFNGDGILSSWKQQNVGFPNPIIHTRCNVISSKNGESVGASSQSSVADKLISEGATRKVIVETPTSSEVDSSKAKLLEALLHSQTRARKAEQAAREANAEKEDILKLFFKQASHLFAYKQWFYLLQLENLYYQLKSNKNQHISSLFPIASPQKTRKIRKNWPKKRAKRAPPRHEHDLSKYAIVFALGLSLVGAGLLLGWTVGWMFPAL